MDKFWKALLHLFARPKPDPKELAARRSRQIREAVFSDSVHEYRILRPDQLPEHDHYFLEQNQAVLEANGFRMLGDVENVTLTRIAGKTPVFTRSFASANGEVVAGVRHMKTARPGGMDHYTIEFQTEFGDGSFLVTNNTAAAAVSRSSPGITAILYPRRTPCEELLRIHSDALAGKRAANPSLTTTRVQSADDYIHFSRRLHTVISRNEQARGFVKADPRETAARQIFEQQKAIYASGPHELRAVSPSEFPNVDHAFYDRFRDYFAGYGFGFLLDLENMTVSRVLPHLRTFMRILVSDDGTIVGCGYHMRGLSPEARNTEFETEFSDGTFVTTSTARNITVAFPGIDSGHLPASTPWDELLRHHRERIARKLASSGGGVQPVRIRTAEEAIQALHREQELKSKHKRATGLFSEQDLMKIRGRQLLPQEKEILAEIERLKQAELQTPPFASAAK